MRHRSTRHHPPPSEDAELAAWLAELKKPYGFLRIARDATRGYDGAGSLLEFARRRWRQVFQSCPGDEKAAAEVIQAARRVFRARGLESAPMRKAVRP